MSDTEKVLRRAGFTDSAAEVARLEAENARLKAVLEECRPTVKARIVEEQMGVRNFNTSPLHELLARIEAALKGATPAPLVPTLQEDPHWITMQTCMHHNDSQRELAGCPVCMMNDAEALATALETAIDCAYWRGLASNHQLSHPSNALTAYRQKHPPAEPKETP